MMLFCFLIINQRRWRSISSSLFSLFLVELLAKMMVSQVTKKFNGNFGEQGHVWLIGTWLLRFWLDFFKKFQRKCDLKSWWLTTQSCKLKACSKFVDKCLRWKEVEKNTWKCYTVNYRTESCQSNYWDWIVILFTYMYN